MSAAYGPTRRERHPYPNDDPYRNPKTYVDLRRQFNGLRNRVRYLERTRMREFEDNIRFLEKKINNLEYYLKDMRERLEDLNDTCNELRKRVRKEDDKRFVYFERYPFK